VPTGHNALAPTKFIWGCTVYPQQKVSPVVTKLVIEAKWISKLVLLLSLHELHALSIINCWILGGFFWAWRATHFPNGFAIVHHWTPWISAPSSLWQSVRVHQYALCTIHQKLVVVTIGTNLPYRLPFSSTIHNWLTTSFQWVMC
jgi:hypothetical protein